MARGIPSSRAQILRHRPGVPSSEHEVRPPLLGTGREERHRRILAQLLRRGQLVRRGRGKGGHPVDPLPRHSQPLPAGGQQPQVGAAPELQAAMRAVAAQDRLARQAPAELRVRWHVRFAARVHGLRFNGPGVRSFTHKPRSLNPPKLLTQYGCSCSSGHSSAEQPVPSQRTRQMLGQG